MSGSGVKTFPCWYCQKPILMEGPCSHDDAFSREFDTPVHRSCVRKRLEKDPKCEEALLIAGDVLDFHDGINFALDQAIPVFNEVQNKIAFLTTGSDSISERVREAWNKVASFLTENFRAQSRYLEKLKNEKT